MEIYEEKYKEALRKAKDMLSYKEVRQEDMEYLFPELKESEDERIRKTLIKYIKGIKSWNYFLGISKEQMIAWLEKQDNSDKSLYIRFGDIPTNGKSKVYNGEIEIGIEEGISVYPAFEDKEGNIILGLNLPITKTSLHTQQHLLEYDNRPCYLVTGDYVGKGTDGEPLIKNVRIIKEIKPYRIKQDKENNTYIINNTPNCGISVYNEELKDSADERKRKSLITFFQRFPYGSLESAGISPKEAIAWLEKQGEQPQGKSALESVKEENVESKFHEGDWILYKNDICKIVKREEGCNILVTQFGIEKEPVNERNLSTAKLWDISDAKDGDILNSPSHKIILIYKDSNHYYVSVNMNYVTENVITGGLIKFPSDVCPATKDECTILFTNMKKAGFEWNEAKKELKKINNK